LRASSRASSWCCLRARTAPPSTTPSTPSTVPSSEVTSPVSEEAPSTTARSDQEESVAKTRSITTDAARHRCLIVAAGLVVFVPTRGRFRVNTTAPIVIRMAITGHMAGINIDLLLRRGGSRPTSPSCRGCSELIVTFATLKMRPPPLAPTSKPYPQTDSRRPRRTTHSEYNDR
jgi:hypothetical protein